MVAMGDLNRSALMTHFSVIVLKKNSAFTSIKNYLFEDPHYLQNASAIVICEVGWPCVFNRTRIGSNNSERIKRFWMARKRYPPEEIIGKLRSAEVWRAEGVSVAEVVRRLGVQCVTYYCR